MSRIVIVSLTSAASHNPRQTFVGTTATVLLLLGVNILLSSEVAMAFALAWLGYCVLTVRRDGHVLSAYYDSLLQFSEQQYLHDDARALTPPRYPTADTEVCSEHF